MFNLYLEYKKWSVATRIYLASKLAPKKDLLSVIHDDIISSFYAGEKVYCIYKYKESKSQANLIDLIKQVAASDKFTSEIELQFIYDQVVSYLEFKFSMFTKVKVMSKCKNGNKYIEISRA